MAHFEISVGRLYWSDVRNYVGRANAKGSSLTIWESEGFLARDFVISGPDDQVAKMRAYFVGVFGRIQAEERRRVREEAARKEATWHRRLFRKIKSITDKAGRAHNRRS